MNQISLLMGWKGYAAAGLFSALISAGAVWWVTSTAYKVDILSLEKQIETKRADDTAASLKKLNDFISGMQVSVVDYEKSQGTLFKKIDGLSQELKSAQKLKPLPTSCAPDAERVRIFLAAIYAANAAALGRETGGSVPSTESAGSQ